MLAQSVFCVFLTIATATVIRVHSGNNDVDPNIARAAEAAARSTLGNALPTIEQSQRMLYEYFHSKNGVAPQNHEQRNVHLQPGSNDGSDNNNNDGDECLSLITYTDSRYVEGWKAMAESVCQTAQSYACVTFNVIVPFEDCRKAQRGKDTALWLGTLKDITQVGGGCIDRKVKINMKCYNPDDFLLPEFQKTFTYDGYANYLSSFPGQIEKGMGYARAFAEKLFPHITGTVLIVDSDTLFIADPRSLMNEYTEQVASFVQTQCGSVVDDDEELRHKCIQEKADFPLVGGVPMRFRTFADMFRTVLNGKTSASLQLRQNYDMGQRCFQTGVMVANLADWRTFGVSSKFVEWTGKNYLGHLYSLGEQDAFNLVFHGRTIDLPSKYNFYGLGSLKSSSRTADSSDDDNEETRRFDVSNLNTIPWNWRDSSILHWSGPMKPWLIPREVQQLLPKDDLCNADVDVGNALSLWFAVREKNPVILNLYRELMCNHN